MERLEPKQMVVIKGGDCTFAVERYEVLKELYTFEINPMCELSERHRFPTGQSRISIYKIDDDGYVHEDAASKTMDTDRAIDFIRMIRADDNPLMWFSTDMLSWGKWDYDEDPAAPKAGKEYIVRHGYWVPVD